MANLDNVRALYRANAEELRKDGHPKAETYARLAVASDEELARHLAPERIRRLVRARLAELANER